MVFRKRELNVSYILYGVRTGRIEVINNDPVDKTKDANLIELILSNGPLVLYGEEIDGVIKFEKDGSKVQGLMNFVGDTIELRGIFRSDLKGKKYTQLNPTDYNDFMNYNITVVTPENIKEDQLEDISKKFFEIF